MRRIEEGPLDANVMLVGAYPEFAEMQRGKPFSGYSGSELTKMLAEAGLPRETCFLTNVLQQPHQGATFFKVNEAKKRGLSKLDGAYPSNALREARDTLWQRIDQIKPNVLVPMGNEALWALTGEIGCDKNFPRIAKWRGSIMESNGYKIIPTYNPASILRNWPNRWISVQDFKRVSREAPFSEVRRPPWEFILRPSLDQVLEFLESLRGIRSVCDLETRGGQIACIGFARDKLHAICIPLMCVERQSGFFSYEEEFAIWEKLRDVLLDPNTSLVFQHGLYDLQYFARQLGFVPNVADDTIIMMHVCFPGLRKSLDFQSSLFCDYYCFWKDDGKTWTKGMDEEQLWHYNCLDCVYTMENLEVLENAIRTYGLEWQYRLLQDRLRPAALRSMLRGMNIDLHYKEELKGRLQREISARLEFFEKALGHPLNPDSNPQMKKLFYTDFGMTPIINRKTGAPTVDNDALDTIAKRQPILRLLCEAIQEYRSIRVFKSTFAEAALSDDLRMRCSFNITGTHTFRLSSSEDAFGSGGNLQNLPEGTEKD